MDLIVLWFLMLIAAALVSTFNWVAGSLAGLALLVAAFVFWKSIRDAAKKEANASSEAKKKEGN